MNRPKRTEAEQQELLEYLRSRYVYDTESGNIRHVKSEKALKLRRRGTSNRYYEAYIRWKGKLVHVYLHHAVWALCMGRWPVGTIDHIDNNPQNNHIENLRECSMSENRANVELWWRPNSKTGVPGIEKDGSKYRLWIRGERYTFSDSYEAFYWAFLCGKRYKMN